MPIGKELSQRLPTRPVTSQATNRCRSGRVYGELQQLHRSSRDGRGTATIMSNGRGVQNFIAEAIRKPRRVNLKESIGQSTSVKPMIKSIMEDLIIRGIDQLPGKISQAGGWRRHAILHFRTLPKHRIQLV